MLNSSNQKRGTRVRQPGRNCWRSWPLRTTSTWKCRTICKRAPSFTATWPSCCWTCKRKSRISVSHAKPRKKSCWRIWLPLWPPLHRPPHRRRTLPPIMPLQVRRESILTVHVVLSDCCFFLAREPPARPPPPSFTTASAPDNTTSTVAHSSAPPQPQQHAQPGQNPYLPYPMNPYSAPMPMPMPYGGYPSSGSSNYDYANPQQHQGAPGYPGYPPGSYAAYPYYNPAYPYHHPPRPPYWMASIQYGTWRSFFLNPPVGYDS